VSGPSFVLVRDRSEINAAVSLGLEKGMFLCTNGLASGVCAEKGLRHSLMDEALIKEDYRAINQWAMDRSLFFIDRLRDDKARRRFLEIYFYDVKAIFIRCLKYILVLEKVVLPAEACLHLFGKKGSLLELTYRHYAEALRPSLRLEVVPGVDKSRRAIRRLLPKRWIERVFARTANAFGRRKLRTIAKGSAKIVIASGSLGHLAGLVDALKSEGAKVVWCENRFNLEKFWHCLRRGIPLAVLPELERPQNPFESSPLCEGVEKIVWKDRDLTELYNQAFANLLDIGLLNKGFDPAAIEKILAEVSPFCVVMDEDIAIRRAFTILARERAIRRFVVSHSVPTVTMLEEGERPRGIFYDTAVTLVNSEHERVAYESFYYDPAKLVVTGTPRYDELYRIKMNSPSSLRRASKKGPTVLYCGQTTFHYDLERHWAADLLGSRTFHWDFTERCVKDVLAAAEGRPGTFVRIKPHYSDRRPWEKLISAARKAGFCELLAHDENIFRLLAEADLVITMPSSVICEAIALEKPVIVMNYGADDQVARYERRGVVEIAHSAEELHEAFTRCLTSEGAARWRQKRRAYFDYFAGPFDGRNTARVVERILSA